MRTRYARERIELPPPESDFAAYADAIVEFVHRRSVGAIVPCIDSSVLALHRRRAELSPAAPAIGSPAAVETAISKPRTLALAATLGIPAPRSIDASTATDLEAAAHELGLPVVVKPVESWRDEDAGGERLSPTLVTDERELADARRLAPAVVQELATGVRETIKLFRVDGRVVARFAMRVDRCWPPLGGSSVYRESIALPGDALERAEALVDAMALDGYSEVEFRRDAAGEALLMEVNPRLSQSIELAISAGIDFASMQVDWALGCEVQPVASYRTGVRLGWLAGEARLAARSRPPFGDYLLRRTRVEGLDLADPAPIASALAFTARSLVRRRETPTRAASPG
jgi:biotin carboxylase